MVGWECEASDRNVSLGEVSDRSKLESAWMEKIRVWMDQLQPDVFTVD